MPNTETETEAENAMYAAGLRGVDLCIHALYEAHAEGDTKTMSRIFAALRGQYAGWDEDADLYRAAVERAQMCDDAKAPLTMPPEPYAPAAGAVGDVESRTKADWRYRYLTASPATRRDAETLATDGATAMARVESVLSMREARGGAGAWLENESLLAVRRVLEDLRTLLAAPTPPVRDAREVEEYIPRCPRTGMVASCGSHGTADSCPKYPGCIAKPSRAAAGTVADADADVRDAAMWRAFVGEKVEPCRKCGAIGRRAYGSTATWRGGIGGQAITDDVCDVCWGSGDSARPGANLRKLFSELAALRAARTPAGEGDRA